MKIISKIYMCIRFSYYANPLKYIYIFTLGYIMWPKLTFPICVFYGVFLCGQEGSFRWGVQQKFSLKIKEE